MPLIKIGKTYYNETERAVYLLQGQAVRDAEWAPVNDKPHAKVSVLAQNNAAGDALFVNVNGWRDRADEVAEIAKRDSVLAVGVLKKREYNGKNYYDLDADFVAISGAGLLDREGASPRPSDQPAPEAKGDFEELDVDDGDLPF